MTCVNLEKFRGKSFMATAGQLHILNKMKPLISNVKATVKNSKIATNSMRLIFGCRLSA